MQHISTDLHPKFLLSFDKSEIEVMMEASESHYDAKCRELSEIGTGRISRWTDMKLLCPGHSLEVELTWSELDLLCKVLEGRPETFARRLRKLLADTPSSMPLTVQRVDEV